MEFFGNLRTAFAFQLIPHVITIATLSTVLALRHTTYYSDAQGVALRLSRYGFVLEFNRGWAEIAFITVVDKGAAIDVLNLHRPSGTVHMEVVSKTQHRRGIEPKFYFDRAYYDRSYLAYAGATEIPKSIQLYQIEVYYADADGRCLIVALACIECWLLGRAILRYRRNLPATGFCPACGYDLRATPNRCPECGHSPNVKSTAAAPLIADKP